MNRGLMYSILTPVLVAGSIAVAGCTATGKTKDEPIAKPVSVSAVVASEQPIARFIRATGTLMAEEQADVAAETGGRIVATPVERGTRVTKTPGKSSSSVIMRSFYRLLPDCHIGSDWQSFNLDSCGVKGRARGAAGTLGLIYIAL